MKNWCFWTVVLEKTLESPLNCKEIQPAHSKGDQAWVFIGRTDAEAETPILWSPDAKSWLIWKDPDAGRDWGQEEKGTTEDEMVGWHLWLNVHEFGWIPEVDDGQGGLAFCGPWGHKESDMTEQLKWTENKKAKGKNRKDFTCVFIIQQIFAQCHILGVSNLWGLMSDDLRWRWYNNNRNSMHNECIFLNTFESSPNHSFTPRQWRNCLLWNQSLVPKRMGPLMYLV